MTNDQELKRLVERYSDGAVYTVEEYLLVLRALLPYAGINTSFFLENINWASQLDTNTVSIEIREEDNIIYPVANSGMSSNYTVSD